MVFLIDASVYIFRAWFSLPPTLTGPDGEPVNAVYGFTGFLLGLLESEQPAHVAAAFDESLTTSFRNALYPDYKASRELPPPELEAQLRACAEVAAALGLATFASPTYEADDLIGGLAATARRASRPVTIVSRDKDLGQLLQDGDTLWDGADRRAGPADIEARFGVPPRAIPDLFGLMGDAVDNIPGVRGIGARTAAALIAHFGDLEALYANLDSIDSLELRGTARIRRLLEEQREMAILSRELARVVTEDLPVPGNLSALAWKGPDIAAFSELSDRMGFGRRFRERATALAGRGQG